MTDKQKASYRTLTITGVGIVISSFLASYGTSVYKKYEDRVNLPSTLQEVRDADNNHHLEAVSLIEIIVNRTDKQDKIIEKQSEILSQIKETNIELRLLTNDNCRRLDRIESKEKLSGLIR